MTEQQNFWYDIINTKRFSVAWCPLSKWECPPGYEYTWLFSFRKRNKVLKENDEYAWWYQLVILGLNIDLVYRIVQAKNLKAGFYWIKVYGRWTIGHYRDLGEGRFQWAILSHWMPQDAQKLDIEMINKRINPPLPDVFKLSEN